VCFNDGVFGLSTAHSFPRKTIDIAPPDDDSDFEFSFDNWDENENLDEVLVTSTVPGQ